MNHFITGAGALMVALSAQASQAGSAFNLDPITVFANRDTTRVARTGATVEIVTKKDLQASGQLRVADFLTTLPGISISSNGGLGTATSLRVRGAAGQYLKVYVDGIEVDDPSQPQTSFDFGSLMTADVSRIEVLKGAQSALYGSDAIAGVVNITTNQATENGASQSASLEYGSYQTGSASYNFSARSDRSELSFTLSHIRTRGFSAADKNAGNTERDGHRSNRLSFSGTHDLSDTLRVGMSGFYQNDSSQYDSYSASPPYLPVDGPYKNETADATSRGLRLFAKLDGAMVRHTLSATVFENKRRYHGTNFFGPFSTPYLGRRQTIAYAGIADLSKRVSLAFGADYSNESYASGANRASTQLRGIYTELHYAPTDRLDVVTSLRHDRHSAFGGRTTGRLSIAYRPRPDLILRLAAGTGFRAPSLFELYDPSYGNPALSPERSTSLELGVEKQFAGGGFARITGFDNRITDLIGFAWPAGYTQIPGTSRTRGVEFSGRLPLSKHLSMGGNLTYTHATDAAGNRLNRVPKIDLGLNLAADFTNRLAAGLSAKRVAGLLDGGKPMPNYTVVGMNVRYRLNRRDEAYLRVVNLFNEQYQTVRGYGQSDRAIYVGLRAKF